MSITRQQYYAEIETFLPEGAEAQVSYNLNKMVIKLAEGKVIIHAGGKSREWPSRIERMERIVVRAIEVTHQRDNYWTDKGRSYKINSDGSYNIKGLKDGLASAIEEVREAYATKKKISERKDEQVQKKQDYIAQMTALFGEGWERIGGDNGVWASTKASPRGLDIDITGASPELANKILRLIIES